MNLKTAVRALSASVVFTAATIAVPAGLNSAAQFAGIAVDFGGTALAQNGGQGSEEESRVTPAMSEAMFKKFGKVQELGNPEEEGVEPNLEQALIELNKIREECREKCNKYELATMYNYYGWVYYGLEQTEESIEAYENLLAQSPEIPMGLELSTIYRLAQLHYAEENYQDAIRWLDRWLENAENVGADPYMMRAQINYQLGDFDAAIRDADRAVSMVEQKGDVPAEGWYNLQRALYLDREDYQKGIEILEKMLVHYPQVQYWRQLSQLYGAVGREADQMYVLDALYVSNLLDTQADVKNLGLLLLNEQVPYKASKVLRKGIDDELLENSARNLEILANALRLAQEIEESIPVMRQAAQKSDEGNLFAQLAAIYVDADDSEKAVEAAELALDKGEVKRPGNLYLTKGMAHFNLEQYDNSVKAFREAAKIDEAGVKEVAERWIQHVLSEKERAERTRRSAEQELPEAPPVPQVDV